MKRVFGLFSCLAVIALAILACNLPANSDRIERYVSGTQTADTAIQNANRETASDPTKTSPPDPEPLSRCDMFTGLDLPVFLLDVYTNSPSLVIYIEFPEGVIGLEDGTDDGAPWEYSATLGDVESLWCAVFEEVEYTERLYCMLPLPKEYHNAAKPLTVQVNNCDTPIVSIPRQSVVVMEVPATGSGGGSSDGSESGQGSGGIQAIIGIFSTVCGEDPWFVGVCREEREAWCACMGGIWETSMGGTVCDCILP